MHNKGDFEMSWWEVIKVRYFVLKMYFCGVDFFHIMVAYFLFNSFLMYISYLEKMVNKFSYN